MEKYNHWLGKLLKKINGGNSYAITLGQTIYYSESMQFVDEHPRWRKHENRHQQQWKEDGTIKFALKYVWYQIRYGYIKNPYEVEAREYGDK